MIMGQSGPYLAKTTHDHGRRPKCLNVKSGYTGYNGLTSRSGPAVGAIPQPATIRAARQRRSRLQQGP